MGGSVPPNPLKGIPPQKLKKVLSSFCQNEVFPLVKLNLSLRASACSAPCGCVSTLDREH